MTCDSKDSRENILKWRHLTRRLVRDVSSQPIASNVQSQIVLSTTEDDTSRRQVTTMQRRDAISQNN